MENKSLTCIQCPLGCALTVSIEDGRITGIKGNSCKRGESYAQKEITAPTRTVTSTVRVVNGIRPVVAVKTKTDIPKEKIFDCMNLINKVCASAPIEIGDVILPNLCGTGVDLVATAQMPVAVKHG